MAEPEQPDAVEVNLDRISDLPSEVRSHILSFLPTKEAIRTSVLSTRWRYLFHSLTKLDFSDELLIDWNSVDYFQCFVNIADRLIVSPTTLDSLRLALDCKQDVDISRVYDWIAVALGRGVKELDLWLLYPDWIPMLPNVLYTNNKSLVSLTLDMAPFQLKVPTDTNMCFPALKTLHLASMEILDQDSIERLLSSCIALEDLIIDCCFLDIAELHISIPTLKRLEMIHAEGWSMCLPVISAPELVKLSLDGFQVEEAWIMEFLKCSPNLSSLALPSIYSIEGVSSQHEVPYCLINHLKEIKFYEFDEDESDLFDLIAYFLMHARVLEKLTLYAKGPLSQEAEVEVAEKLFKIPRSSSEREIVIL